MDGGMKFVLGLLVLTTLLSMGVGVRFFLLEEETYQKYVRTEQTLTEKNFVLKDKLGAAEKSKSELERQLQTLTARLERAIEIQATLNREYQASRTKMDNKLNILVKEKAGLEEKIKRIQPEWSFAESLKEKTILEVEVKSLKDKLASQEARIRNLSSERTDLQKRLEELKGVRQAKEEVLKEAREALDLLRARLAQESQNSIALSLREGEVKSLKDKLARQEARIRNLSSERTDLQKRLEELKGVRQAKEKLLKEAREASDLLNRRLARESQNSISLSENLERIRKENSAFQQQLAKALKKIEPSSEKEGIELSPIMVKAASPSPAVRGGLTSVKTESFPAGRILSVSKRYKFVIIDLGQEDGIKPGMSFDVYRDSSDIGRIEVLETHPEISAADVRAVRGEISLRPDDIVKMRR